VYLSPPKDEQPVVMARPHAAALLVSVLLVLLFGIVLAPWYEWAAASAAALF
jgi:NADH:ubiquinone oxidoreductase subunit 2 (subunit N)